MNIRAWIGRLVNSCLDAEIKRQHDIELEPVGGDIDRLSDAQLSDLVHGRPIDWSTPGSVRGVPPLGRVS